MPEDILNNIRAFVRNQSASSLMQMMQNNNTIDIALQEALKYRLEGNDLAVKKIKNILQFSLNLILLDAL